MNKIDLDRCLQLLEGFHDAISPLGSALFNLVVLSKEIHELAHMSREDIDEALSLRFSPFVMKRSKHLLRSDRSTRTHRDLHH